MDLLEKLCEKVISSLTCENIHVDTLQQLCWKVLEDPLRVEKVAALTLPPSKHRWLTTVSVLRSHPPRGSVVLCGDRKGSLHLYHLSLREDDFEGSPSQDPIQTLHGVHGPNGVTHSCFHGDGVVYTCGRNGLCLRFALREDDRTLVRLASCRVSCAHPGRGNVGFGFFIAGERAGLD